MPRLRVLTAGHACFEHIINTENVLRNYVTCICQMRHLCCPMLRHDTPMLALKPALQSVLTDVNILIDVTPCLLNCINTSFSQYVLALLC